MKNGIRQKFILINIFMVVILTFLTNCFSQIETQERIMISLSFFGIGIIASLLFSVLFYVIYHISELRFQIFTMLFLIGSLIGIITAIISLIGNDDPIVLNILIPLINIFLLCIYIRFNVWKIDRGKNGNLYR